MHRAHFCPAHTCLAQLISEAYDVLKTLGGLTNEELHGVFSAWNKGELASFLIEISAIILGKKDDQVRGGQAWWSYVYTRTPPGCRWCWAPGVHTDGVASMV